jgi:hypothetical protein
MNAELRECPDCQTKIPDYWEHCPICENIDLLVEIGRLIARADAVAPAEPDLHDPGHGEATPQTDPA